ncbi:glycosyltransferase [Nitrosococcus wardiae]|uniref:Glycosyltransferase family 2 protein n=1 Tax=Nitrosococcus wardiae TaxID=1814290 RepID=A0A4P7BZ74_9GAMM|nr:glycosyltransferase [Nitrosococcus wardiae]QBQ54500.1 glycosyltransferase family 2 protein [Nitrosococcus wardiae]
MSLLIAAVCTYNRSEYLPNLIKALRSQSCQVPFEILVVDNNSTDDTPQVLVSLAQEEGVNLRFLREMQQGIVFARNRAIEESAESDYLVFIDDDEIPLPGFLRAAVDALEREGADCVGGQVKVKFDPHPRPHWLTDDLLGFLAEINYGSQPFWITNTSTPIWTANIAYRMSLFRSFPSLRFDFRYNREGKTTGGGEDAIMFKALLSRGARIRYRPDMAVEHFVEPWKLKRSYFLKFHYYVGVKFGHYEMQEYQHRILNVPPFMIRHALKHISRTLNMYLTGNSGALRQAMNATHALGAIYGFMRRQR